MNTLIIVLYLFELLVMSNCHPHDLTKSHEEKAQLLLRIFNYSFNIEFSTAKFKGVGYLPELPVNWTRKILYKEQLVIISDWDGKNTLRRCDMIEVYKPSDRVEVLRNLTAYPQNGMTFEDMKKLMVNCDHLDEDNSFHEEAPFDFHNISFTIGILPGTRWCGPGDIANGYNDLGSNKNLDRCCRMHDLCPVKIFGMESNYGLKNEAWVTKSHCDCDDGFYDCLKNLDQITGSVVAIAYFNLLKPECIQGSPDAPTLQYKFAPQRRKY